MGSVIAFLTMVLAFVGFFALLAILFRPGKRLAALAVFVAASVGMGALDDWRTQIDPAYAAEKQAKKEAEAWKDVTVKVTAPTPPPVASIAPVVSKLDEGEFIPRSIPGDKGRYYLMESRKVGDIITSLHKRIGVDSTGWTRTEINCKKWKVRDIGYSEDGPQAIKPNPTKWYDLVEGSSKSDLVNFVCR